MYSQPTTINWLIGTVVNFVLIGGSIVGMFLLPIGLIIGITKHKWKLLRYSTLITAIFLGLYVIKILYSMYLAPPLVSDFNPPI